MNLPYVIPWVFPFASLAQLARRLPRLDMAPQARSGSVTIVVPARNEERNITRVLASLSRTTHDDVDTVVVDDRSTDDTHALAAAHATHDSRLRVIRGVEPSPGWYGKPWACHSGAAGSTATYLLFTDADTVHEPELLAHAIGAMERDGAAVVTVLPYLECISFWERVVMPQVFLMLAGRYPARRVNAPRSARDVIANGQFILIRRDAYESIGGHAAVRGEVAEDLALAQVCFRAGLRLRLYHAESLLTTRMYTSLGELVEGWSKNLHLGARRGAGSNRLAQEVAPWLPVLAMVFWLAPIGLIIAGSVGAGFAALGLSMAFWMFVNALMRIPAWYALCYPAGCIVVLYIALRSNWRRGRRVEWRGRTYSDAPLQEPAAVPHRSQSGP